MNKLFKLIVISLILSMAAMLSGGLWYACKKSPTQSDNTSPQMPDTTSHNFTWQIDTLGAQGFLTDVSMINDTDVWVVGEIYLRDSTGAIDGIHPYNAAHWNGQQWGLVRIWYDSALNEIGFIGGNVFAFSHNDVWANEFSWDGQSWTYNEAIANSHIGGDRIWGTSDNNLYFAGITGTILHKQNNNLIQLNTGMTLPVVDIYGDTNRATGQLEILCAASSPLDQPAVSHLYHINGTTVTPVYDSGLTNNQIGALWFKSGEKYVMAGEGIFVKNRLDSTIWSCFPPGVVTSYGTGGVDGQDTNDIITAGSFGEITHYNGSMWMKYPELLGLASNTALGRVQIKGNSVFAVGTIGNGIEQPIVVRGKRN